jgi:NADH-quinone oxidoreductase subunit H
MIYLIEVLKVVFIYSFVMGFMYILLWMERKQSAVIQDRIGANRATIFGIRAVGLFHNIADGIKLITKEDFIPPQGNRFLHTIAPMLTVFFAIMAFAVVPFGGIYQFGDYQVSLQVLDLNVALLYVFATLAMTVYGFVLAGWASANNFSMLGGLRASSQMISYEITLGATVIGVLMIYGTINLQQINIAQGYLIGGWIPMWGVIVQPLGFILFTVAALAETKRVPFDIPEGESEIIGYFVEYSGMKFAMFWQTDFIETILASSLIATLFFGGWQFPYLYESGFIFPWGASWALPTVAVMLIQVFSFMLKVFLFAFLLMFVRWTLPRFRWDQLMRLGWAVMLPLSIANIIVTGVVLLIIGD